MTNSQPDPIPHLITAVTELGFALRDLDASRATSLQRTPLAQDSEEYADEIHTLIKLILGRLHEEGTK